MKGVPDEKMGRPPTNGMRSAVPRGMTGNWAARALSSASVCANAPLPRPSSSARVELGFQIHDELFWKNSQITSTAFNMSVALPTTNSGNRFLPPGQTWPWPSMVMKTTSAPELPEP